MILNTIITGLGICLLIGVAVYFTEKMNEAGSSIGFMWFTEKRIARPIENLAEVAGNYYLEHSDDHGRETILNACEQYAGDSTEVGNLARSYISMVKDLETYVINLKSVTAEKERINAELTLASDIQAQMGLEVNDVFTVVNQLLCEGNDAGLFVTAWMGILDVTSGKLTYANAGHTPLLKQKDGSFIYLKSRPGLVLAGMEGIRYRKNELTMEPGDRLFLYTDGVTEATNADNQLYGEERLKQFMDGHIADGVAEVLPGLKKDIDNFVGEAPQFDDITMLVLDLKKNKAGKGMETMFFSTEKVFPAKDAVLSEVLEFAETEMEKRGCPMKAIMQLTVALEEISVNIAHYAYPESEGEAKMGIPFDPLAKPDPDVTLNAKEREIGGLGIYMMKKTMDEVSYSYENGHNILTMKKKL